MGPTRENLVPDPITVLHLNNIYEWPPFCKKWASRGFASAICQGIIELQMEGRGLKITFAFHNL